MHILATTDGLEHAWEAITFTAQLATQAGAQVTVLGVAEQSERDGPIRRAVADASRLLQERGIEHRTKLRHGYPAEQILQEVEQDGYDLLVMGARGRSRLTRFLLGSVSFQVLEHTPIPLLIVRQARPQIRKILVAIGGRPASEPTMRYGTQLAHILGAQETLLHVTNPVPQMFAGLEEMEETLPELLQSDTEEGRILRKGVRMMNAQRVEGHIELRYGLVEEEIIHEAMQGDYDLIVIGSSLSAGPIGRLLMGNITRRVIDRTWRPVLVVPGQDSSR